MAIAASARLLAILENEFLPAVAHLGETAGRLASQTQEASSPYDDDLAKLMNSVERMRDKAGWIARLVQGDEQSALDAGTVRHDLRTPMSGVLGYAELLLEEMVEDRDSRFVEATGDVISQANVVLKVVNSLLMAIDENREDPAVAVENVADEAETEQTVGRPASAEAEVAAGRIVGRILVVDDNGAIRDLVSRRLSKQGHDVTPCASGEEAIRLTETVEFDLIMLDLMMPGLSGDEVLHVLKEREGSAAIPVIVMSALDEIDTAVRCIQAGADDYLSKPLNPTLLTARIETLLERKFLRDREQAALALLKEEQIRSDMLLHNIFPASVVKRLGDGEQIIADHFNDVTVLFCDLVGFTALSSRLSPIQTLGMLNEIFSGFDALAEKNGVEKIKTVGDAYILVAGVPDPVTDPAWRVVMMAREMASVLGSIEHAEGLQLRIGISKGPAAAGVVGTRKLFYDVWGDTVNLASRLEGACLPGRILVSDAVRSALGDRTSFDRETSVDLHGLGAVTAFYLA